MHKVYATWKQKKTYTLYIIAKRFYKTVNDLLQFRQHYLPRCIIHNICVHCVYIYNLWNEIYYTNNAVLVGHSFVETKPVYAVKETTLESCYYGDVSSLKEVKDAHYWDWKTCRSWHLRDYKKTWSLKKEDLEHLLKESN